MRFFLIFMTVALLFSGSGFAGATYLLSPDEETNTSDEAATKGRKKDIDGTDLEQRVNELLGSESSIAMALLKQKGAKRVIIDGESFSRDGQVGVARAVFLDGGGPRQITMVVDAFGDSQRPLASFPYSFESTGSRQPLEARFRNLPAFKRFSLRFMHDGIRLDPLKIENEGPRVTPVSPDAMLFHADYSELRELLEEAGYMESKSYEPAAMFGAVRRFRIDFQLDGPGFVSLRDLFALRVALGKSSGKTSLLPYVEWSSGSQGGWMEDQEVFSEEPDDVQPDSKSFPDIFEGIDPAAENDADFSYE